MTAALDLLAEIPGRRIAVLGDMAELGAASQRRAPGRRAARRGDRRRDPRRRRGGALIAQAAREAGHRDVHHWPTKEARPKRSLADLRPDDVVLLKASRAMALETLVDALKE